MQVMCKIYYNQHLSQFVCVGSQSFRAWWYKELGNKVPGSPKLKKSIHFVSKTESS